MERRGKEETGQRVERERDSEGQTAGRTSDESRRMREANDIRVLANTDRNSYCYEYKVEQENN